jgi:serine/threonine protein kinase
MKVMRLSASASESARARFVREATVLARLEHPNIVPIHELGRDTENRL